MNNNEFHKKRIGSRIRVIRNELGLTMKEFGKRFNPPASDSIVSRWERGVSSPNNERLERIAELGNISMFYLTTGKKALADLTDDEKKEAVQGVQESLKKHKEKMQFDFKGDIEELLNSELSYVETTYLSNMLNFLKYSDPQDINGLSSIVSGLLRYNQYKEAEDADKEELHQFLENELDDITSFFHEYLFRDSD